MPLRKILETASGNAWWQALRDYRQCLGSERLEDFLERMCHRRSFRILAILQIKRKMAVPSSRKLDTPGDIARQLFKMLEM